MSEIEVWIDQRERHVIPFFDALDSKKVPPYKVELRTLSAGDYAIVYRDWIIMLIERKSWEDLAATFLDRNRKFNYEKMIEERNKFDCKLFYLVEGKRPVHNVHHVTVDTLEAHLDHLLFDHNIVTIYSQSAEKTPERIFNLVKHYMSAHSNPFAAIESKLKILKPEPEIKEGLKFNLSSLDKNIHSASSSLSTAKGRSEQAIDYALWNCIEGMTEQNYTALKDIGVQLSGLLCGQYIVQQLEHAKYRLGNLVGEKKLTKILTSAIQPEIHVKVLQQVDKISVTRAKAILAVYKLPDIIIGTVTEDQLAEIQVVSDTKKKTTADDLVFGAEMLNSTNGGTSRKLGIAAAKNVVKYLRFPQQQQSNNS